MSCGVVSRRGHIYKYTYPNFGRMKSIFGWKLAPNYLSVLFKGFQLLGTTFILAQRTYQSAMPVTYKVL